MMQLIVPKKALRLPFYKAIPLILYFIDLHLGSLNSCKRDLTSLAIRYLPTSSKKRPTARSGNFSKVPLHLLEIAYIQNLAYSCSSLRLLYTILPYHTSTTENTNFSFSFVYGEKRNFNYQRTAVFPAK